MPASELFPHEPSVLGDVAFGLMMLSTAVIICHALYSIIKRRNPLPKLCYKLLIPDFIIMMFAMFVGSSANHATHFLTRWGEVHVTCFCFGVILVYGFLGAVPGIESDISIQPPRKRGVGRLMFPKLHRLMRKLRH